MTFPHRLCWPILSAALLFGVTASAADTCPATPKKYRDAEFGDARFAIEEGCDCTLTQDEQFFIAGIAQKLSSDCRLPKDRRRRALVERFTKASTLAMAFSKADGPLPDTLQAQRSNAAAFAAGLGVVQDIRCNGPEAALLERGIVIYLERTSKNSRFVAGCVEFYGGRYTEAQCQCITENLRAVLPDVDQRFFDREIIKESIHHSPFIALPLMLSCGLWNY